MLTSSILWGCGCARGVWDHLCPRQRDHLCSSVWGHMTVRECGTMCHFSTNPSVLGRNRLTALVVVTHGYRSVGNLDESNDCSHIEQLNTHQITLTTAHIGDRFCVYLKSLNYQGSLVTIVTSHTSAVLV